MTSPSQARGMPRRPSLLATLGFVLVIGGIAATVWSADHKNFNALGIGLPTLWAAGIVWASSARSSAVAVVRVLLAAAASVGLAVLAWQLAFAAAKAYSHRGDFIPIEEFRLDGYFQVFYSFSPGVITVVFGGTAVAAFAGVAAWAARAAPSGAVRLLGVAFALVPFAAEIVQAVVLKTPAYAVAAGVSAAWLVACLSRPGGAPAGARAPTPLTLLGMVLVAVAALLYVRSSTPTSEDFEFVDEALSPGISWFLAGSLAWASCARSNLHAVTRGVLGLGALFVLTVIAIVLPIALNNPGHTVFIEIDPSRDIPTLVPLAAACAAALLGPAARAASRPQAGPRRWTLTAISVAPVAVCVVGAPTTSVLAAGFWLAAVVWLALFLQPRRTEETPGSAAAHTALATE